MGFQQMIHTHTHTFPLVSKEPQDGLNAFHVSDARREMACSLDTAAFSVFRYCLCPERTMDASSSEASGFFKSSAVPAPEESDKKQLPWALI